MKDIRGVEHRQWVGWGVLATLGGMVKVGFSEEVLYKLKNEELQVQHAKSQGRSNAGKT